MLLCQCAIAMPIRMGFMLSLLPLSDALMGGRALSSIPPSFLFSLFRKISDFFNIVPPTPPLSLSLTHSVFVFPISRSEKAMKSEEKAMLSLYLIQTESDKQRFTQNDELQVA